MKTNKRLRKTIMIASVTILNLGLGQVTINVFSSSSSQDAQMNKHEQVPETLQSVEMQQSDGLKSSMSFVSKGHITVLK